jgi:ribose transport system ATP-binding protein
MVGRDVSDLYPVKTPIAPDADVVLSVRGLSVPGFAREASFELKAGEILGLGGLIGSGRTELMEGLCGLRPSQAEQILLFGEDLQIKTPGDAQKHGLCYLTEDRKLRGLLLNWSLRENLTLQTLSRFGIWFIEKRAEERALDRAIEEFDIRAGSRDVTVGNLSGGNQQKLLLAKVMLSGPRILVVDEPTRGIDIGTKQQIYVFLRDLAAQGVAVIVISSEMPELIGLANRILVMRQGQIEGELAQGDITEDAIVRLSMGLSATSAPPPSAEMAGA